MSPRHETFSLPNQIVQPPAALVAAGEGNQAEGAHEVAAVLNFQVGPSLLVITDAFHSEIVSCDGAGMKNLRDRPPGKRGNVPWQLHLMLCSHNQVDLAHLPQNLEAGLGIAAGDRDEGIRRGSPHSSDKVPAVRFSARRYGAGIEDEEIRRLSKLNEFVALATKLIREHGGFRLIETTSNGM